MRLDREKINDIFNKLAILAGSRKKAWVTISRIKLEKGRTPTLGEVLDRLAQHEERSPFPSQS